MSYENALCQQVFSLPDLIEQQYEDLEPKTRKVLTTPEIMSLQRIVLTGCGDPFAAALSTRHAFEELTGLPTEVVPLMELSRYYQKHRIGQTPIDPLIIAVSNYGEVARMCEAVERVRCFGGFTLAVTERPDSSFTKFTSRTLHLEVPDFVHAPGTRSYLADVMALLLLAIRIGEVRAQYTMDRAMDYRYDLRVQGDKLRKLLPGMNEQTLELAKEWKDKPAYEFIASGPEFGTAWYAYAKVFEAVGKFAMYNNIEDWLHMNFFVRSTDQIATFVIANSRTPALSRIKELIGYAKKLERPLAVITDGSPEDFDCETSDIVAVPDAKYPFSAVLTQYAPINLLLGYVMKMIGEEDGRGFKGPWSFCKNGASVVNSEIVIVR